MVVSVYFFGLLVGVNVMAYVSDRFGRKMSLIPSWVVLILCQSLLAISPSVHVYMVIRFVAGMCTGKLGHS